MEQNIFSKDVLLDKASFLNLTVPLRGQKYKGGIYIGNFEGKRIIIAEQDATGPLTFTAAKEYCSNLKDGGFNDWYLPNKDELNFLYDNAANLMLRKRYWSSTWNSTEFSSLHAWFQDFRTSDGFQDYLFVRSTISVVAIRSIPVI